MMKLFCSQKFAKVIFSKCYVSRIKLKIFLPNILIYLFDDTKTTSSINIFSYFKYLL